MGARTFTCRFVTLVQLVSQSDDYLYSPRSPTLRPYTSLLIRITHCSPKQEPCAGA
eukprot:COSAG05_NODE_25_length_31349_cov_4.978560_23_plen_56_part_00